MPIPRQARKPTAASTAFGLACIGFLHCGCEAAPVPVKVVEVEAIDVAGTVEAARLRGSVGHALSHSKLAVDTFIPESISLDPAVGVGALGDALATAADQAKAACPGLKATHVPGSNAVSVSLPVAGCQLAGLTAAGLVDITATVKDGKASVELKLSAVKIRNHQLDGVLRASSTDGKTVTTEIVKLQFDTFTCTWQGSWQRDANGKGSTSTGTGTVQKTGEAQVVAITATGLHQNFQSCYANAGTVSQTLETVLVSPKTKAGQVLTTTLTATFDAETPREGIVAVTLAVGASKPTTPQSVTLPKYGDCPDGTAP